MPIKFAIANITSHHSGKLYAPKGAELTISHYNGHVAFCSWNGGELFPCRVDLLGDVKPPPEPVKIKRSEKDAALIEEYLKMKR